MIAYEIYQDNLFVGISYKTNYTVEGLLPNTRYTFHVKSKYKTGNISVGQASIKAKTKISGKIINILDYGAVGDGVFLNTDKIQKAIDECLPGSTILIPEGTFLTGALFLKSNMNLYIDKNAILKGSIFAKHYKPLIRNRFEGWELDTYASLLNAGVLNSNGECTTENISIRGTGTISGGGMALGGDMIASRGMRSRGRLICLMNCKNVSVQGLTIEDSPCWTIHYIYSKNITLHDLTINSRARNGDGIDPDSSADSYIFNCTFNTNDDCIAIKSGKNPEGNRINRPSENIFISDCNFIKGHGISIGSEMSGGVRNIVIRDCFAGNLMNGLQIKATKERGGYVENILVQECELPCIKIVTSVSYNNDGEPASSLPLFRNFEFSNIRMNKSEVKNIITLQGFDDKEHYCKHVLFSNILLPAESLISVSHGDNIIFSNVYTVVCEKPVYIVDKYSTIVY